MPLKNLTHDVYRYALSHLEKHKAQLDELITHIRTQVGTSILPDAATTTKEAAPSAKKAKKTARKKRVMSDEARAKVGSAQKLRWEKFHAAQKQTTDMLAKLERNAKKAPKKATQKAKKKKHDSDIPF